MTFAVGLSCAGPDFVGLPHAGGSVDAGGDGGDDANSSTVIVCSPCDDPTADAAAGDATATDLEGGARDSTVSAMDGFVASDTFQTPGASEDGSSEGSIDSGGCGAAALSCNGACVPSDAHHCGTCTNDCTALKNVSGPVSCIADTCSFPASSCTPSYADCNGDPSDGCETDITQPAHCGSCNIACNGGTPVCTASSGGYACASGCPSTTPTLCSGTCADTTNNANNCGACGNACTTTVAHAQPTCVGSSCSYNCNSAYSPCNGACVDTTTDANNCGSCGNACMGGMTCAQSACGCPNGTLDCNGVCATCSAPPSGGVNVCSGSTCTFACTGAGLTKCGSACTDVTTDGANCGACGHDCQGGTCSAGQCQPVTLGSFSSSTQAPFLAINSNTAYVGISGSANLIEKCPLTGCVTTGAGLVTSLSFSQFGYAPNVLANDSGVYWIGGDGSVGGYVNGAGATYLSAPTNTSTMPSAAAIAVDSSNIYWTTINTPYKVMSCPIGGCPGAGPSTLETGSTPVFITAGAGYLYWQDGNKPSTLMKCAVGGCGTSPTPLGTSAASVSWIPRAADSANVYFVEPSGGGGGTVNQCAVTGCKNGPIPLGSDPTLYLSVDATDVYWIASGAIVKCTIGGCGNNPTTVLTSNSVTTQDPILAVDSTSIYWMNGATLMKVAK